MQNLPEKFNIEKIPLILRVEELSLPIRKQLEKVLIDLKIDKKSAQEITDLCLGFAQKCNNVTEYENNAHRVFESRDLTDTIQDRLKQRAEQIVQQAVQYFMFPGNVLDLGCGDGQVGSLIAEKNFDVQLADIYKHPNIDKTGLKYDLLQEDKPLPYKNDSFDNILLGLVLHHSEDPDFLLREAWRILKVTGKIVLIESVHGVQKKDVAGSRSKKSESFLRLDALQQKFSNGFFDHLYNRIMHYSEDPSQKVNVPLNFDTPGGWKKRIRKAGLNQEKMIHLGMDHAIVPEWHTLHVLNKL